MSRKYEPFFGPHEAKLEYWVQVMSLTPNTVELIPTPGALSPRGGPVQDPVLTSLSRRSDSPLEYIFTPPVISHSRGV